MQQLIKIVLVGTTHPGNIGAVARAMKNMRLTQLALVDPKIFPSADATSRASGAHDLLADAQVCQTLDEAISDCNLVFGASARSRTITWPEKSVRECAITAKQEASQGSKVAFVFGREHSGLTNQELDHCHYLLRIPCNTEFSSLNLAAAVQVVSYELFMAMQDASLTQGQPVPQESPFATAEQMDSFYSHLRQTLTDIGFMHPDKSKSIMRRLRRLFNRSRPECKELDILRGVLTAAQNNQKPK